MVPLGSYSRGCNRRVALVLAHDAGCSIDLCVTRARLSVPTRTSTTHLLWIDYR